MFVVMIISNFLATRKFFGGRDNKEISDEHPTILTPDGKTFAIWGLIYTMLMVTVIAQLFPSGSAEGTLLRESSWAKLDVRWSLIAAFLCNALWLPVFNNEWFKTAFIIIVFYLVFLLSAYLNMVDGVPTNSFHYALLEVGVSMNTSWIVIACLLNFLSCAGDLGWKKNGVAGNEYVAIAIIIILTLLAAQRSIDGLDFAWAFVTCWALRGVYRMQTEPNELRYPSVAMNLWVASAANWGSIAAGVSVVIGFGLRLYECVGPYADKHHIVLIQ